jgi:tRNA (cmo5U34)-methyltransferase
METNTAAAAPHWDETASQHFIDYGHYFVPEREQQMEIFCTLIPARAEPFNVLELCCGAGVLAGAILARHPTATVYGYDGSREMLQAARVSLAAYGPRWQTHLFELAETEWRKPAWPVQAVVSSLAIHHLDGGQKQALFQNVYAMLAPEGVFVIADVMLPAPGLGWAVAANAWDRAVEQRALALAGNLAAFTRFEQLHWNMYRYFDPADLEEIDKPSSLLDQLKWLESAGFADVDVYWMQAGHAIFGGRRPV